MMVHEKEVALRKAHLNHVQAKDMERERDKNRNAPAPRAPRKR